MSKKTEYEIPAYKEAVKNRNRNIGEEAVSTAYRYVRAYETGFDRIKIDGIIRTAVCARAVEILKDKGFPVKCISYGGESLYLTDSNSGPSPNSN
jgi:hypothetical protein